jgi:hypothetical protein
VILPLGQIIFAAVYHPPCADYFLFHADWKSKQTNSILSSVFGFKMVKMANKKTRVPDKAQTNTGNIVVKKQEDAIDIVQKPPVFTDDSK